MVKLAVEWCDRGEAREKESVGIFFPFLAAPFLALRQGKGECIISGEGGEGSGDCRYRH